MGSKLYLQVYISCHFNLLTFDLVVHLTLEIQEKNDCLTKMIDFTVPHVFCLLKNEAFKRI